MNRSELVESVGEKTGLDKRQSEDAVKAVIDVVVGEIKSGNKVSIFGFGTFAPTSRAARVGRNPQTGTPVNIAASTGVRFSPATALKATLNPKPTANKSAKKSAQSAKKSAQSAKKSAASAAAPAKKAATSTKKAAASATATAKKAAASAAAPVKKAAASAKKAATAPAAKKKKK